MRIPILAAAPVAFLLGACGGTTEPEPGPALGTLRATVITNGGDLDLDGYSLVVDGQERQTVSINTVAEVRGLPAGSHQVALDGVASNCDVEAGQGAVVTIESGRATQVTFTVTCYATGIEFTVVTTGLDPPLGGFQVAFGTQPRGFVPANGTTLVGRLTPGSYVVGLALLGNNCSVEGATPALVTVQARQVARVSIAVTCVAVTGVVEVTVQTTGVDQDPTGYTAIVGPVHQEMPANGTARLDRTPAGSQTVLLDDVASNCVVLGGQSKAIQLAAGGLTRDTARVRFDVLCVRTERIAYTEGSSIGIAYEDGSNAVWLASGTAPAWSPGGTHLVFEAIQCLPGYSYPPGPPPNCGPAGLAVVTLDNLSPRTLTSQAVDQNPSWSPDGTTIAFDRQGRIHLIDPAGGVAPNELSTPGITATDPTWSPDGTRIAFTCTATSVDLCVMNRDGSGLVRLTTDSGLDTDPAWSPDGSRIAFTTTRFSGREDIAVIDPAGGGVTRIVAGFGPSWSGNGSRIVFSIAGLGLATVNADGTGQVIISRQAEYAPAWRP